jgi:uncharacterized protein
LSDFFVDTSALAKRYIVENGSKWIRSIVLPRYRNRVLISKLATVEMISVLARKQRERILTASDVTRIRKSFFAHVRTNYAIIKLEDRVFNLARYLLIKHSLRTLDAFQLASALYAVRTFPPSQFTFITADKNLLAAAAAEGLQTNDPNLHP